MSLHKQTPCCGQISCVAPMDNVAFAFESAQPAEPPSCNKKYVPRRKNKGLCTFFSKGQISISLSGEHSRTVKFVETVSSYLTKWLNLTNVLPTELHRFLVPRF